jgi:hypothetical protein
MYHKCLNWLSSQTQPCLFTLSLVTPNIQALFDKHLRYYTCHLSKRRCSSLAAWTTDCQYGLIKHSHQADNAPNNILPCLPQNHIKIVCSYQTIAHLECHDDRHSMSSWKEEVTRSELATTLPTMTRKTGLSGAQATTRRRCYQCHHEEEGVSQCHHINTRGTVLKQH